MIIDAETIAGKKCPYCEKPTQFVDSSVVYKSSYGMIYICWPCKAWVGTHKGSEKSLGTLAKTRLRELRNAAHFWFDKLWKDSPKKLRSENRHASYIWLSNILDIPKPLTHIGMFNEEQCRKTIEACKAKIKPPPIKINFE